MSAANRESTLNNRINTQQSNQHSTIESTLNNRINTQQSNQHSTIESTLINKRIHTQQSNPHSTIESTLYNTIESAIDNRIEKWPLYRRRTRQGCYDSR